MIKCNNCDFDNYVGMLVCIKCGMLLNVETSQLSAEAVNQIVPETNFGTALLDPEFKLVLHIGQTSLLMLFPHHSELTLGRAKTSAVTDTILDPEKAQQTPAKHTPIVLDHQLPFLDLEPFGGMTTGVSRTHARIENNGDILTIIDLNSTNGTRLNGDLLPAGVKRILRDNDVISLGLLKIRLKFYQDDLNIEPEVKALLKAEDKLAAKLNPVPQLDPTPTHPVRPEGLNELVQAATSAPAIPQAKAATKSDDKPENTTDDDPRPTLRLKPDEAKEIVQAARASLANQEANGSVKSEEKPTPPAEAGNLESLKPAAAPENKTETKTN